RAIAPCSCCRESRTTDWSAAFRLAQPRDRDVEGGQGIRVSPVMQQVLQEGTGGGADSCLDEISPDPGGRQHLSQPGLKPGSRRSEPRKALFHPPMSTREAPAPLQDSMGTLAR